MAHTVKSKAQLIARVRRIAGQLKRIEDALEEEAGCEAVLHMLAGARGAFTGLSEEIIADFVREHVSAPRLTAEARRAAGEELIILIRRYAQ
jgi:DNA-binding FrmR family transcriptional regulator